MKTKAILMTLAAAFSLAAQEPTRKMVVDVPFAFEANGQKMPAGSYKMLREGRNAFVRLEGMKGGKAIMLMALSTSANTLGTDALVFHRYGDKIFLHAIADKTSGFTIRLPEARTEKEMARAGEPETLLATAP